jgi:hypothetical protein
MYPESRGGESPAPVRELDGPVQHSALTRLDMYDEITGLQDLGGQCGVALFRARQDERFRPGGLPCAGLGGLRGQSQPDTSAGEPAQIDGRCLRAGAPRFFEHHGVVHANAQQRARSGARECKPNGRRGGKGQRVFDRGAVHALAERGRPGTQRHHDGIAGKAHWFGDAEAFARCRNNRRIRGRYCRGDSIHRQSRQPHGAAGRHVHGFPWHRQLGTRGIRQDDRQHHHRLRNQVLPVLLEFGEGMDRVIRVIRAFADLDRERQFRGCVPFQMKRHGGGWLHAPAGDDGNSHGPCERAISAVFERDRQPERRARAIQGDGSAGSVIADGGVQDADGKKTRRIGGRVVGANGRKERNHTKEPAADHTSQIIIFRPDSSSAWMRPVLAASVQDL